MNDIIVLTKRSVFPLTRFYFSIEHESYFIRSGELKKIKLDGEGEYEITVHSFWISKKTKLFLKNMSILNIKHIIPDLYYLVGIPTVVIMSILAFLGLVNVLLLSGIVLLYLLPLLYFTFLKSNYYFKINIEETICFIE